MKKRRLKKGATITLGTILCLPVVISMGMFLHAESDSIVYTTEEVPLRKGVISLQEMKVKQNETETLTCAYPYDGEDSLCKGIIIKEDGIYRTKDLLPGSVVEGVFQPYTYHMMYLNDGVLEEEEFNIERQSGSTLISFPGKQIEPDTWTPLEVIGEASSIHFTCDDPNVNIQDGQVKASDEVTSFQVVAHDAGNETTAGQDISATFSVKQKNPETLTPQPNEKESIQSSSSEVNEEPQALAMLGASMIDYDFEKVWWRGSASMTLNLTLNNKNDIFTIDTTTTPGTSIPIPNHTVYLQGQFVNIADPAHQLLPGETPETLSEQRIRELFQNASVIPGSAFDTSAPYAKKDNINILDDVTWSQQMSLFWPKEEGIYLVRYRLYDSHYGLSVPLDGVKGWHYNPDFVFGIDTTLPNVQVEAKRTRNTTFHDMSNQEVLASGDEIRISVDADIAGLQEVKYRFLKPDENAGEVSWITSKNAITNITIPAGFDAGGTLEVEVYDQTGKGTKSEKSYTFIAPVNYIMIHLPEPSEDWTNTRTSSLQVTEPDTVPPYDGILISYVNDKGTKVHADKFISKNELKDHVYNQLELCDGTYTLQAKAVTGTSADDAQAIDDHIFTSKQMVDATSTLEVTAQAVTNNTLPVRLKATTGPSGVKEISATCTYDGKSYTKTIKGNQQDAYSDQIYLDGTCSYTLYNKAGLASASKSITSTGLNYTFPVLDITAFDPSGNQIESGDSAERFIRIKADDINPNTSTDHNRMEICINDVCEDYKAGSEKVIEKDANIVFRNKDDVNQIYGTFEIKITGNIEFGTITIANEQAYTGERWYGEDQTISATLTGAEAEVFLEYAIDGGDWKKTGATSAFISVNQAKETSGTHEVVVRAYKGNNDVGSRKTISVNIDNITPALRANAVVNDQKSSAEVHFTPHVGGSGIISFIIKDQTAAIDLSSTHIDADQTLKPYTIHANGTYIFQFQNALGAMAETSVTISELNENIIKVTPTMLVDGKQTHYDGSWTSKNVQFTLSGGLVDMSEFDHYEMKQNGTWKSCESVVRFDQEQDTQIQFKVVKKDHSDSSLSETYTVKIDKLAPSDPTITIQKVNDHSIAKFLSSISFNMIAKEAMRADITSTDTLSKVSIYYQLTDEQGVMNKDPKAWEKYTDALILDREGKTAVYAVAIDEAGNVSNVTPSDGVVLDFTKPVLHGVDEEHGYIPRIVTYEDALSGLSDDQVFTLDGKAMTLSQEYKLKDVGVYHFELSDKAGNVLIKDFTLKQIPNKDEINGDDAWQDIIDEINKEYEDQKDHLSEDEKKEIEDQIKEIEDAYAKQRTDELIDQETGASIKGNETTTFPKDAILSVKNITDSLTQTELESFQKKANSIEKQVQDVYRVTLMYQDQELPLQGSATLTIPMTMVPSELAYSDDTLHMLQFTESGNGISFTITTTGDYVTLTPFTSDDPDNPDNPDNPSDPNDPNNPDNPNDPNGGNQGDGSGNDSSGAGHSVLGSYYGGGLNTGDLTNYAILFVTLIMSMMILSHARTILHNKGDE